MSGASPDLSDFIVYADESGDHGMVDIDPGSPVFALVFCVMRKEDYVTRIVPAMQDFKFKVWGHDSVILHERKIHKARGPFAFLRADPNRREQFFRHLNSLIKDAPMTIYASIIKKDKHQKQYANPWNPYEIALHFCMGKLWSKLSSEKQQGKRVHVVFESRGSKEDQQLELQFRRIATNQNMCGSRQFNFGLFEFEPLFIPKDANAFGLQLADLTARPIALSQLSSKRPNCTFEAIDLKLEELKCFP